MNFAKTALDLFYKTFGRRILKTAADNKWVTNMIQKLKSKAASTQKTSDVAKKVREGMKKDKPFHEGFKPTIVPKTKIVPKKPNILGDALKTGKYKTVPTPKGLKPPSLKKSNVIPFPKKPPGKADGGRIDKALPGRSRDI
jgi:hypothetical protein